MTVIINGTTGITNVNGSASAPAETGTDTDSGIVYGTNTVSLATNGTTAVTVDASQNVGIGATINNVFDQVAGARPLLVQKSDTNTTLNGSLAAITITNGDTTTSNTAQLNFAAITGASTNQYSSAVISGIFGARTNGQYPTGQLAFSTSTTLNAAPTEKMRVDSDGNVGIGQSSITRAFTNYNQLNISGSTGATIQMQSGATSRANLVADSNALYIAGLSGAIAFGVNGTGTGTEVGRFGSTGLFQFNSGYGSVATAYGCRAWVNFNGTGTVAIRASGNVTSITDNAVGNYTINLTTAMPDVNYCCSGTCEGNGETISVSTKSGRSTSAVPLIVVRMSGGANVQSDNADIDISVHR